MAGIPEAIAQVLLPHPHLSVLDLIRFPTPPKLDSYLSAHSTLFSEAPSAITNQREAIALLRLCQPCLNDIIQCQRILEEEMGPDQQKYQSINYPVTNEQTLKIPIWVLEYWEILEKHKGICEQKELWLAAETNLKREQAHNVLNILATIPWSYKLPRHLGSQIPSGLLMCYLKILVCPGSKLWRRKLAKGVELS